MPVIEWGTPLPATRSNRYETSCDDQEVVEIVVYQGESSYALDNVKHGAECFDAGWLDSAVALVLGGPLISLQNP